MSSRHVAGRPRGLNPSIYPERIKAHLANKGAVVPTVAAAVAITGRVTSAVTNAPLANKSKLKKCEARAKKRYAPKAKRQPATQDVMTRRLTSAGALCVILAMGPFTPTVDAKGKGNPYAKCNQYAAKTQSRQSCRIRVWKEISPCKAVPFAPCVGPLEAWYTMSGSGEAKTPGIKVSRGVGTQRRIPEGVAEGVVETQQFSWKAAPNVRIVAAFIQHDVVRSSTSMHRVYQRIPTGPHGGQVTLERKPHSPYTGTPMLLIEGEEIHKAAQKTRK